MRVSARLGLDRRWGVAFAIWLALVMIAGHPVPDRIPRVEGADAPSLGGSQRAGDSDALRERRIRQVQSQLEAQALQVGQSLSLRMLRWREPGSVEPGAPCSLRCWEAAQQALFDGSFEPVRFPRSEGFQPRALWFVASVYNRSGEEGRWIGEWASANVDRAEVWIERSGNASETVLLGDHWASQGRPLPTRQHASPVRLAAGEEVLLWVRIESRGVIGLPGSLKSLADYYATEAVAGSLLGMLVGVLLVGGAAYGCIGLWLREGALTTYGAFLLTLLSLFISQQGLLMQWAPWAPWWLNDLLAGVGSLGPFTFGTLMWVHALEVDAHHPILARLLRRWVGGLILLLPLGMTSLYLPLMQALFVVTPFVAGCLHYLIWCHGRRGHRATATVYFAALAVYHVGAFVLMGLVVGWIPSSALMAAVHPAASVLHVLIMALILGWRLLQTEKRSVAIAERAQMEKRMTAMLTHEFRNPLSSIDRSANLLQVLDGQDPAWVASRAANIRQQARRLGSLVDGFLSLGAAERTEGGDRYTEVDLRAWVDGLVQAMGPDLSGRFQWSAASHPVALQTDTQLLAVALNNVLDNAVRYSPGHTVVRLECGLRGPNTAYLTVTDAGPGLPPDALEQLGTAHWRGPNSLGRQGTGLGYYFAREVVAGQGGALSAANGPQGGLEVTMQWPARRDGFH